MAKILDERWQKKEIVKFDNRYSIYGKAKQINTIDNLCSPSKSIESSHENLVNDFLNLFAKDFGNRIGNTNSVGQFDSRIIKIKKGVVVDG